MMWPDNLNWQMTVAFLLALALLGFAMKLVALLLPAKTKIQPHGISWILVSPDSALRSQPVSSIRPVLLRFVTLFVALLLGYWVYWQIVRGFHIRGILVSYLAVPILVLMGEFLVALVTLILLPGGRLLPALHRRPWLAHSVADFWGDRWNLWFSDWFRYTIFSRLRHHPIFALFLAFAVSGLAHEWVINAPLYCLAGRALFGSMMAYFLLQAAGILSEHYFLKGRPRLLAAFVWLVVFVPSPLVLNEGLLRVLHLWPE
jgi:Membrane bound O-acyl transferase family